MGNPARESEISLHLHNYRTSMFYVFQYSVQPDLQIVCSILCVAVFCFGRFCRAPFARSSRDAKMPGKIQPMNRVFNGMGSAICANVADSFKHMFASGMRRELTEHTCPC